MHNVLFESLIVLQRAAKNDATPINAAIIQNIPSPLALTPPLACNVGVVVVLVPVTTFTIVDVLCGITTLVYVTCPSGKVVGTCAVVSGMIDKDVLDEVSVTVTTVCPGGAVGVGDGLTKLTILVSQTGSNRDNQGV